MAKLTIFKDLGTALDLLTKIQREGSCSATDLGPQQTDIANRIAEEIHDLSVEIARATSVSSDSGQLCKKTVRNQ